MIRFHFNYAINTDTGIMIPVRYQFIHRKDQAPTIVITDSTSRFNFNSLNQVFPESMISVVDDEFKVIINHGDDHYYEAMKRTVQYQKMLLGKLSTKYHRERKFGPANKETPTNLANRARRKFVERKVNLMARKSL